MEFARIGQRLQEIEIKTAFLEKELEEYKEATQSLHARVASLEEGLRQLQRAVPEPNVPETKLASV
jgi:septal ring factor EnvC (AmiA/AmiB activator)